MSPLRGLMGIGAVVVVVVGAAVAFWNSLDYDGTPFSVRNSCTTAIYVDNGHDGLTIAVGQTIEVAGFGGDLDLLIGRPGHDLVTSVTFTSTDVTIGGALCPEQN